MKPRLGPRVQLVLIALGLVILGTWAYSVTEDLDLFHAFYFLVISVTTVGYGDMYPTNLASRIITLLIVPVGLMVVFGLGVSFFADRLDDHLLRGGAGRIERKIRALRNHFVVCGYGRLGREVVAALQRMGSSVVVVDKDQEVLKDLEEQGSLYVVGDALEEKTLTRAGIREARCVIATFSDDTLNVYLILEIREVCPELTVISSASGRQAARRLYLAGASRVVSPQLLGGDILAKSAHNPHIYQLMSDMISGATPGETISQIVVSPGSQLAGKHLREFQSLGIGARVMLIREGESTLLSPAGEVKLEPDMVLVVVGEQEDLERLDQLSSA